MEWGQGHEVKRPFHRKGKDAEHNIDDLQVREGLDKDVEIRGEDVPEDLGPEETLDTSTNLNC